ncbi:F0F1 ATP synthase subunit gamma [Cupriavidus numazuensis]|uniref:ATP synthase gamma chain n=1 Tax=Cupriavidus numazuensis TaxID=221992 RepID=A0ABM8TMU3_9BURK|nr:F0F1 ATP synthase subunit gamma [Cupriavidus numazuensis]CAG2155346.1 ATP synthase gamma chain [Cupriavidus numazuensis]
MSGQHALRKRAALLSELQEIVQAMKNVASAEVQRATRERQALTQALLAVADGLAQCVDMDLPNDTPTLHAGKNSWLAIGAERGFCGTFNARLLQALRSLLLDDPHAHVLLASHRASDRLDSAGNRYVVLPGCATVDDAPAAIDTWLAALDEERRQGRTLWLLHTSESGLVSRRLLPEPDLTSIIASEPAAQDASGPPIHYLSAPLLQAALQRQAFRLLVQTALCESLEHENRSRLSQMQLAQAHLEELGHLMRRRQAAQRQADITNELETLTSILAP